MNLRAVILNDICGTPRVPDFFTGKSISLNYAFRVASGKISFEKVRKTLGVKLPSATCNLVSVLP